MTGNYFFEYQLIPDLFEKVKKGINPIQSLIDIEWMKGLVDESVEIHWSELQIDIYDSNIRDSYLDKCRFITYSFPQIVASPEAKWGVIDIQTGKYFTFESDSSGTWFIGGQDNETHINYGQSDDMTKLEFVYRIKNMSAINEVPIIIIVIVIVVIISLFIIFN